MNNTEELRSAAGAAAEHFERCALWIKQMTKSAVEQLRKNYDDADAEEFTEFEPPLQFNELIQTLHSYDHEGNQQVPRALDFEAAYTFAAPFFEPKDHLMRARACLRRIGREEPSHCQPNSGDDEEMGDDYGDDDDELDDGKKEKVVLGIEVVGVAATKDNLQVRVRLRAQLSQHLRPAHAAMVEALRPWYEDMGKVPSGLLEEYNTVLGNDAAVDSLLSKCWAQAMSDDKPHLHPAVYKAEMRAIRVLAVHAHVQAAQASADELLTAIETLELRLKRKPAIAPE